MKIARKQLAFLLSNHFIKLVSLFVAILFLTSCGIINCCTKRSNERDSTSRTTNTITVIHDTLINVRILGDTVFRVSQPDAQEVSELSTHLAHSFAWIEDGKLNHRLEQPDTMISTLLKGAVRETDKTISERSQTTKVVNQLTGWQWFQIYLGRSFLAIIVLITVWFLLKKSLI